MFTLQLLHASDLEGGVDAVDNAPNFAALVEAFEGEFENTVVISAGDNYIPGPFFNAAADSSVQDALNSFYSGLFGVDLTRISPQGGAIDIAIMNAIGFDASAIGNHEFDNGAGAFADIISVALDDNTVDGSFGESLDDIENIGALFPYLSTNLDFDGSPVAGVFTDEILASDAFAAGPDAILNGDDTPKVAPATIIEVPVEGGVERVGVIGATTQIVETISSPGDVTETTGGENDMAALAAVIQPRIDALIAEGVNKIVVTSHLQQLALEEELATLLTGVDIIIAGGSDTLLADETDTLRPGDEAERGYPVTTTDAAGNPVAIVSTDGEYSYVGRLVVDFDENGVIIPESIDAATSGAFATTDEVVAEIAGDDAFAEGSKGAEVQALTGAVTDVIASTDGEVFGVTDVFLEGRRSAVRTEETNLGNLTADAYLAAAQRADETVQVAIKNGGGIRAAIGSIENDPESGETTLGAPEANEAIGKPEGGVSRLDVENSLRFNNSLALVTLSSADLKIILEHGVAATAEGATPGQFPQIAGLAFSFDPTAQSQELSGDRSAVTTEGQRVQTVVIRGETPADDIVIVENGEVVDGAPEAIRVTTLDFLAGGGDDYPFDTLGEDIQFVTEDFGLTADGDAENLLAQQDALATFLEENFPDGDSAFDEIDTPIGVDGRIQNLSVRTDSLDAPQATDALTVTKAAELQGPVPADAEDREGASEVVSVAGGLIYSTNGANDAIDIFDGATTELLETVDLSGIEGYAGVQSVVATGAIFAAAIDIAPAADGTPSNGVLAIFDAESNELITTVETGALPDAVVASPDGMTLLVANEGEFNSESEVTADAPGGVTIVTLGEDGMTPEATTVTFDGLADQITAAGLRIFPGIDPTLDLEPENIAFAPNGSVAYVTLQENNGVAVLDLETGAFTDFLDLGTVDFSAEGQGADFADDDVIAIENAPVFGLRMPDAIAAFEVGGEAFFMTANEGDGRGDAPEGDEARVGDILDGEVEGLSFDESVDTTGLERLIISTIDGDTDGDGDIDEITTFGSRSFTIFDAAGAVVFDSGPQFSQIIADLAPERFLDDDGELGQNRADAKGSEPEALAVGEIDGRTYAFIGLERDSGVMIYDVTDPANATFVTYIDGFANGDISPETIAFIPAAESGTGFAQIAVAHEISGETVLFDLATEAQSAPTTDGDDVIAGPETASTLKGGAGDDAITGNAGDDLIFGGDGNDEIDGGADDDRLKLGAGDDTARGGEGDDDIRAFDGDDEIDGGAGDDVVFGQNGADRIEGGAGLDRLVGGEGGDTFVFADGAEEDRLIDFEAGDLLDFTGVEGVSGIEDLSLTAVDPHVVIKSDADPDLRIVVAFTELEALEDGSAFIFG